MSSGKSYEAEVWRPRLVFVTAHWLCIAAMICAELCLFVQPSAGIPVIFASLALIFPLAFLMKRFPTHRRGTLSVSHDKLLLDGQPILKRRNIGGVFPVIVSDKRVLIEQRRIRMRPPITIELASREEVSALVNDLRWDEAHAAQEFTLIDSTRRLPWKEVSIMGAVMLFLGLGTLKFHFDPNVVGVLILGTIFCTALAVSAPTRMFTKVRVGTDGLLVRLAGKKRFIPYQHLASVERTVHKVTLRLSSGESIELSHGRDNAFQNAVDKLNPVSLTAALFERIENARALFSSRAEIRSHLLAALKRDGRSLEEWRRSATELSREQYRVAATPRDVLENIVQDSAVAPDVRIGAAIALHADAGTRVRVATETSALPELGKAIDAALDGDDSALEKAIATLKLDA